MSIVFECIAIHWHIACEKAYEKMIYISKEKITYNHINCKKTVLYNWFYTIFNTKMTVNPI